MGFELIWDELTDSGALSAEYSCRAEARFDHAGGGIDTAIAEVSNLDAGRWKHVMNTISRTLGYPLAKGDWLDRPDQAGWRAMKGGAPSKGAVFPAWTDQGVEIYVIPTLAPHFITQTLRALPEHRPLYLAAESEIWDALGRHFDVAPPKRFESLWLGQCPAMDLERTSDGWGPMPFAALREEQRSHQTLSEKHGGSSGGTVTAGPKRERDTLRIPSTSPARPRALGMADTAEHLEGALGLHSGAPRATAPVDDDIFGGDSSDDATAVDHTSVNENASGTALDQRRLRLEPATSPPA